MKIYERIVEDTGFPQENDLWIKKTGDGYSIFIKKAGEWVPVGGSGGGGASGDAITYTEQELTEEQKMQARKNQGLYYSEIIPDQLIVEWDGNTDGLIGLTVRTL